MKTSQFDVAIVGGGIVGLATAHSALARFPGLRLRLLEKEPALATHQTGHNSGVIHSGVYYAPGSLKAKFCVAGARAMQEFCAAQGVDTRVLGKLVIAAVPAEASVVERVMQRGLANGVAGLRLMQPAEYREIEPRAAGVLALHVPGVAIVRFADVAQRLGELIRQAGGEIVTGVELQGVRFDGGDIVLESTAGPTVARWAVNCAGLQADRVCELAGAHPTARVLPFRGEYYEMHGEAATLVRGLIYPAPDQRFPFLGVHFTPRMQGTVEAGPNAVLALRREGYSKTSWSGRDVWDMARYRGAWAMAARYWRKGLIEQYRSVSRAAFLRALQRLLPDIEDRHLSSGRSGVRAQLVLPNGRLMDDFHFVRQGAFLHVLNVPSPAATASLMIGRHLVEELSASGFPRARPVAAV